MISWQSHEPNKRTLQHIARNKPSLSTIPSLGKQTPHPKGGLRTYYTPLHSSNSNSNSNSSNYNSISSISSNNNNCCNNSSSNPNPNPNYSNSSHSRSNRMDELRIASLAYPKMWCRRTSPSRTMKGSAAETRRMEHPGGSWRPSANP